MNEPFKVQLINNALSAVDIYSPTAVHTTRQIAGSTVINHPELSTIDTLYSALIVVERMKWESISYAHIILTPKGEYFLSLLAGPNIFDEYEVLFIPLHAYSGGGEDNLTSLFGDMLLERIRSGQVSCYPGDIDWL